LTSKDPYSSPKHSPTFDIIRMFITIFTKPACCPYWEPAEYRPHSHALFDNYCYVCVTVPLRGMRFLPLIFSVTDVLSPLGIKDDPGISIILSGLELCEQGMRNEETILMVRRTFDTSGLNIVSCHYSGMFAVV